MESTARFVVGEMSQVFWVGGLIEYPEIPAGQTVAQVEASGKSAYLAVYTAENITNWGWTTQDSQTVLDYVVLRESVLAEGAEKMSHNYVYQYRLLEIDEEGFYRVSVYDAGGELVPQVSNDEIVEYIYPLRNGQPLDYIPFSFGTAKGVNAPLDKAPLLDVANLNRAHWINSVDHEKSLRWSGFNMLFGYGISTDEKEIAIGEPKFFQSPEARMEILSGNASSALAEAMNKKVEQMAVMGSNVLAPQGRYVQSAETAEIQASGEASILTTIVNSASEFVTWAMREIAKFKFPDMSEDDLSANVTYTLNTDFFTNRLSPQDRAQLMMELQKGLITMDTYIDNMIAGEIIDANVDRDTYKQELETQKRESLDMQMEAEANATAALFNE